jgi:hypothetical protein
MIHPQPHHHFPTHNSHTMEFLETTERFGNINADMKLKREFRRDKWSDELGTFDAVDTLDTLDTLEFGSNVERREAYITMRRANTRHNDAIQKKEIALLGEMCDEEAQIKNVQTDREDIAYRQRELDVLEAWVAAKQKKRLPRLKKLQEAIAKLDTAVYSSLTGKMEYTKDD